MRTPRSLLAGRRVAYVLKLTNPSEIDNGRFDSDHIGPWTRWQGNLSADLVVVGQDWGDTSYFRRVRGWDTDERNPTDRTLMKLLRSIGVVIDPPGTETRTQVFFT